MATQILYDFFNMPVPTQSRNPTRAASLSEAFAAMTIEGGEEKHQLKPEQISRGANNEYIVSFEDYTFVIPADKALPSTDPCSHIFFPNMWVNDDYDGQVRDPKTPNVRCFLTPLDF